MGTRDTGAYAALSDVVNYFEWLGEQVGGIGDRRDKLNAAAEAIKSQEAKLTDTMVH